MPLAVYVHPLKEELLSSWVMRTCHANATSLYSLLWHFKLNNQAQVDIDQTQSPEFLRWLATTLNHPDGFTGAKAMSLLPIQEITTLFPHKSWIRGIDRRAFKWRSFRFCPQCLQEAPQPYFKRLWRVEWYEVCPKHHLAMYNGCPRCSKPIVLHRISWEKPHVAHCYNCKSDLSSFPPQTVPINTNTHAAIEGLCALISNRSQEDYAAIHFLEALLEQGRRLKGVSSPIESLKNVGINNSAEYAENFPASFLATAAYELWHLDGDSLNKFILENQGWFNLAARDYSCPNVFKHFHRVWFKAHELNEDTMNQIAKEIRDAGVEATPGRIARKIGCNIRRVEKFLTKKHQQ